VMTEEVHGSNRELAAVLRDVATALRVKGADRFVVEAYERAARAIAHLGEPARELWRQGRLTAIPGVGPSIAGHLDEWFRTGRCARFEEALAGVPDAVLELVHVPGIGPATALKLAAAGVEDIDDLARKLERGELRTAGLSEAMVRRVAQGLAELARRPDRMLLPTARAVAEPLLRHLRAAATVQRAEIAGSIRRRCATAGNINIAVAAEDGPAVLRHARALPGAQAAPFDVRPLLGDSPPAAPGVLHGVTLRLSGGQRADILIVPPQRFGALWQWFTGSPAHNAALMALARARGLLLGPDGARGPDGALLPTPEEEQVYALLGLPTPPPELREHWGELEVGTNLPRLLTPEDVRGDCHSHTVWSDGRDSARAMVEAAVALGREYLVITDHSYPNLDFAARAQELAALQQAFPQIRLINGLEVNITVDGRLQVPDEVLAAHQFCLASIHTGFRQPRELITRRLLAALEHPAINGIAHPTGRLLLQREGVDADWEAVFEACLRYDKVLEIDGPADRLDLPDYLVREAVRRGVKLVVDSDAHRAEELQNVLGAVDVARRGWAGPANVLNTLPFAEFAHRAHVRGAP
jgi:DNA polymerase (family 10)